MFIRWCESFFNKHSDDSQFSAWENDMANSKFERVRAFELADNLLPNTWIVIRIDGRGFHKLSAKYGFEKPNDRRALDLMNAAAVEVMGQTPDIIVGYGQSDEYSFVFHKSCTLFERRAHKLTTMIVSMFSTNYAMLWPQYFPDAPLTQPYPNFDGRPVAHPTLEDLRDYLSWRQTDCHINNLYNTTFWALVNKGGLSNIEAQRQLQGTFSADKNEILFSRFNLNYNNEPAIFRKGSVLYHDRDGKQRVTILVVHLDIIKDVFWRERSWIIEGKKPPKEKQLDSRRSGARPEATADGKQET